MRSRFSSIALAVWEWVRKHPSLAIALVIIGIGLQAFFELAEDLPEGELRGLDNFLIPLITAHRTLSLTWSATILSDVLLFPFLLLLFLPLMLYLLSIRHYLFALALVLIPSLAILLLELLKYLFHRPRPSMPLMPVGGYSFPSGHAFESVVIYGLMGYIVWRLWGKKRRQKALIILVVILLVLATGIARVYLGVHYPSDVLAGWSAGLVVLFGSIALLDWLQHRLSPTLRRLPFTSDQ